MMKQKYKNVIKYTINSNPTCSKSALIPLEQKYHWHIAAEFTKTSELFQVSKTLMIDTNISADDKHANEKGQQMETFFFSLTCTV